MVHFSGARLGELRTGLAKKMVTKRQGKDEGKTKGRIHGSMWEAHRMYPDFED